MNLQIPPRSPARIVYDRKPSHSGDIADDMDATALAKLRDSHTKADAETIRKSLVG